MTFSPLTEILGTSPVDTNFSFTINLTLLATETVDNIQVTINNNYFNYSVSGTTINITGNVPIDVFDQYSFKYVDKGSSDKSQTPVVCNIQSVPDHKDLYEINVDSRTKIDVPITIIVKIKNTPSDGVSDPTIASYTQNYIVQITQTYTMIKNWTDNYFKHRY